MRLPAAGLLARLARAAAGPGTAAAEYDVIVVGVGPVGSFMAQLLAAHGVKRVVALEKHNQTYYSPRAVAWDDYTVRLGRSAGKDLGDYMYWHAWSLDNRWHLGVCPSGLRSGRAATRWRVACDSQSNDELQRRRFMTTSGMPVSTFHQPVWEEEMRRRLTTLEGVTASFSTEVLETRIVDGLCEVVTRPAYSAGPNSTLRARFCVAADGKKSRVREQLGLDFNGATFEDQPWIVVDTEVYDVAYLLTSWIGKEGIGFVMNGRDGPQMLFNGTNVSCPFLFFPTPAFFGAWWEAANREAAGAGTEDERTMLRDEAIYRMWQEAVNTSVRENATPHPIGTALRFEFLLQGGMDPAEATSEAFVHRLLTECAEVDPSRLKIIRKVVYSFDARRASKWRVGPVFLAGDAAHCLPPFHGQGMNSGLRDAANLAWKLALVLQGAAHERLLDSYEPERRVNLEQVTAESKDLGSQVMESHPLMTLVRDLVIKFMVFLRAIFGWQFTFAAGQLNIKTDYSITVGSLGGELMPCPEVREEGATLSPHRQLFLDELSAANGFTLVACGGGRLDAHTVALRASEGSLRLLRRLGAQAVAVAPHEPRGRLPSGRAPVIEGLARSRRCMDAEGQWTRWTRRMGVAGRVIVVRPDRYIFGDFGTVDEATAALGMALQGVAPGLPSVLKDKEL